MLKKTVLIIGMQLLLFSILINMEFCSDEVILEEPVSSIKLAVLSDPHYFTPLLSTNKSLTENYFSSGRKLIAQSHAIMKALIDELNRENIDAVLISGDLTKDGEKLSHEGLANLLGRLEAGGTRVFVVPGNHDINNPAASGISESGTYPVESVSPEDFKEIYAEYGYRESLVSDPNSLSYVVALREDTWLICMDGCNYDNNNIFSRTSGHFNENTLNWIRETIIAGVTQNKLVLGMMHHGLIEHFPGQSLLFPEYLVDDWRNISNEFASLGMKVVFTGHFHAQDIVRQTAGENFILDIETGSTVTSPCPYRLVTLDEDFLMGIRSERVTNIDYDLGGVDFQEFAADFLTSGLDELTTSVLINNYGISQEDSQLLSPLLIETLVKHYCGDEIPSEESLQIIEDLSSTHSNIKIQLIGSLLREFYLDPEPSDNNLIIDLRVGNVVQ